MIKVDMSVYARTKLAFRHVFAKVLFIATAAKTCNFRQSGVKPKNKSSALKNN